MGKQLDIGGILGEMQALVQDNLREVLIFSGAVGGLAALGVITGMTVSTAESLGFGAEVSTAASLGNSGFDLLVSIATLVGMYWLTKTFLASRNRIVKQENRFWLYLGMTILSTIGLIIGFILLIIPGIILAVRWSAASGFLVSGREGVIDSLKASWEATRGNGLTIFLAGLVLFIVLVLIIGIITGVISFVNVTLGGIVGSLLEAFTNAIMPAFGVAIYCLVQNDGEQLEEVFS